MKIIKGFDWHLPLAFKDCIAQCKFEQGDIIYPQKLKGENWGESILHFDFLIQVKSPTRAQSGANQNMDLFSSNWESKIVFEKVYPKKPELNKTIETTQGRFYTYLWKGSESVLDSNKMLPPILTSISHKYINSDFIKSQTPDNWSSFAMVMDFVSDLSISKRRLISESLSKAFNVKSIFLNINDSIEMGSIESEQYSGISPTLGVELFLIESNNLDEIQEILKTVLYKGVKNKFSLNTHGILLKN